MDFSGFLGNENLKQRLSASLDSGRSSHCYLLCGPVGSGKHTLAVLLAAALQCSGSAVPCGTCAHCRKIKAGIHPDVIVWDDPEKKEVPVNLIRSLQADAYVRPNEGQRKLYILPRAQDLNDSSGNALLKLLEEPPDYAVFLLLTDNANRLLPTIRSRCVELRLEPVPREEALSRLAAQFPQCNPTDLSAAYMRSGGYLGQAAELLQGTLFEPQALDFARAYAQRDALSLTAVLCAMEKLPRLKLQSLLGQFRQLIADAMLVRSGLPGGSEATAIGQNRTGNELSRAMDILQQALEACAANTGGGHICGWLSAELR